MDLLFFILIITLFLILFSLGGFFGVIWIPTRRRDYERIASLIDWHSEKVFFDLGSGTGGLLFFLSKKYGIECVGIEISPIFYLYSKIKSLFYKKVKIYFGNFFKFDFSDAGIIYAFLHPKLLKRLKEKINKEAKKEVLVILSCWQFENTEPLKINKKEKEISYYLYSIKPMSK
jgi:predicted RNA methylase